MVERPVRDLHSSKPIPPMFCKVIVGPDGKTYLQKKNDKKVYETILWEDVVYQVEAAKAAQQQQKLPHPAP